MAHVLARSSRAYERLPNAAMRLTKARAVAKVRVWNATEREWQPSHAFVAYAWLRLIGDSLRVRLLLRAVRVSLAVSGRGLRALLLCYCPAHRRRLRTEVRARVARASAGVRLSPAAPELLASLAVSGTTCLATSRATVTRSDF